MTIPTARAETIAAALEPWLLEFRRPAAAQAVLDALGAGGYVVVDADSPVLGWMDDEVSIGFRILAARKRKRLTQGELADKTGVCRSTIATIERGKHEPTLPNLRRLLQALR